MIRMKPPHGFESEASVSQQTSPRPGPRTTGQNPAERRVSVRYQSSLKGSCQTLSAHRETSWEAVIRDISPEGVGLLLSRRFEPGALLNIELTDSGDGQKRLLLARVVHATARPEGGWLIGCELISPLTNDEVQALR
jgi:hypothetical protein